jgi:hypothetical protein
MATVYKQGKPKVATKLKGVYTLNPTRMVMKSGSEQARAAVTRSKKTNKPAKAKGK